MGDTLNQLKARVKATGQLIAELGSKVGKSERYTQEALELDVRKIEGINESRTTKANRLRDLVTQLPYHERRLRALKNQ